ncbi:MULTISPECIES: ankyrin repeat domain-containing protein [unclassified Acinetobacter]|uniref:ankyrin repeat domain-containing protein n=1 Tax=unclassified Acinetobacter TaxID=196816 RepID=UPI000447A007|nr:MULTISPECIES: ankyrin repeat domain-containing protein [unclassified Acinetobacter]EZQ11933.1 ankyrin [Acinetobacter sp. Ver3]SEL55806.1 Ankyrin repeat-containing protein [Acinetobacter sp. DSM 11652]
MLTAHQQVFLQALEELDLAQVQRLLAEGLDPNFIAGEKGPAVSVWSDTLFQWWEEICEAYEQGNALSTEEKQQKLQVHLDILDALIAAKANFHLWDAEECYGPLWDAASAACVPAVQRLLDHQVDPNTKDEEGNTILSSISDLFFDCDFDTIDWSQALPEERETLELLRSRGAKMTKELN